MCLELGFSKPTKKQEEGMGWKIFSGDMGGECFGMKRRPTNIWIRERDFRSSAPLSPPEGFGFHIFLQKKGARNWMFHAGGYVLLRVKYRAATAIGRFDGTRVIVAQEIFIEA